MYGKSISYSLIGINAEQIEVESDIKPGLFKFSIVGLPSDSVKESRDRVSAAIKNSGYKFHTNNYTVNLAPADVRKEGVALDLPIAMAILNASRQISGKNLDRYALIGELSLDGDLRPVKGILPVALAVKRDKLEGLIVPEDNAREAAVVEGLKVYGVANLRDVISFLEEKLTIHACEVDRTTMFSGYDENQVDMFDVKSQMQAKRALEIAAAGGHNLLMLGPPGSGKTMLARRVPTILPELTLEEALETTKIHSVAGMIAGKRNSIVSSRPFRSPHHTISDVALIGGGAYPKPGEVSLSHNGVLFLDELPEFKKSVLEVLRQPLEDGVVTISRASQSLIFPAKFMLIASMNPCPCGYYGSEIQGHTCQCSETQIHKYRSKISGPLLDRIDLHLEVPAVKFNEFSQQPNGEKSVEIRVRINKARRIQLERYKKDSIYCNSQMNPKQIRTYCKLKPDCQEIMKSAMHNMGFSARAYDRILKVARTIADLEGAPDILIHHISEAVQYRTLDRKYWG